LMPGQPQARLDRYPAGGQAGQLVEPEELGALDLGTGNRLGRGCRRTEEEELVDPERQKWHGAVRAAVPHRSELYDVDDQPGLFRDLPSDSSRRGVGHVSPSAGQGPAAVLFADQQHLIMFGEQRTAHVYLRRGVAGITLKAAAQL